VISPGIITHTGSIDRLVFGEYDGSVSLRGERFLDACKRARIDAHLSTTIAKEMWAKFALLSAFSGVSSMLRKPAGPIVSNPDTRKLLRDAIAETVAVAKGKGIDLGDDYVAKHGDFYSSIPPDTKSSMLMDLENGRRLELALWRSCTFWRGIGRTDADASRDLWCPETLNRRSPGLMSALGQKRTSEDVKDMSALPPIADIDRACRDVRFVPKADIRLRYSITSPAATRSGRGTESPMTHGLITASLGDDLTHLMRMVTRHRIRHMPVLRDGKLVGIISIGDVVKHRLDDLELEASVLRDAYMASHSQ
jgi:CBS domain-containing protein